MDTFFTIFLVLHIIGGSVGLLTGSINLVMRKGDRKHKMVGRVFVYSMLTAGLSALILSVVHPNYFLFMVGVFTIYMVGTGNRYIYLRMLGINQKPRLIDWTITYTMLLFGVLFVGLGVWSLTKANFFGTVFIAFGAIGLLFVKLDIVNYKGKSDVKNYWLLAHLQRMTGAYIASVTAFIVVNAKHSPVELPPALFWLMPTIILAPLIVRWSRKYEVKITPMHEAK